MDRAKEFVMALRRKRAGVGIKATPVAPQLTLAKLLVTFENIIRIFARPLALAVAFLALAWLGILPRLYPWGHLLALILFVILFFDALGKAQAAWRTPSAGQARRRVEQASGLDHRPLDVLHDRPAAGSTDEQTGIWQVHVARTKQNLGALRWPKLQLDLSTRDPYRLRYLLLVLVIIGVVAGWGALGGRLIAAINPALGKQLALFNPTLDAWITPPEYTGLPPIMIATPAGMRHNGDTIDVPEGSTISAHLMERDGDSPVLVTDGRKTEFTNDSHGDYAVTAAIDNTDTLAIRRGWQNLGHWHIRVVTDKAPQIGFTEPLAVSERKAVRIAYEASDDYGITAVSMRITPRESLPGVSNDPIEVPLATPLAKQVKRTSFEDLTAHGWAGAPVQVSLIATDAAGHRSESAPVDFTLPERAFFNPVARILIEERKKLILHADDDAQRNDIANVMAGIAHQPSSYKGDPLVLLALRTGAVRLVLDHAQEATNAVNDMLWQAAVRVEDGSTGAAERNLREAQKDLADALDRNAGEKEIQQLIDRMHQALAQYLSELATRMAARPGPIESFSQMGGPQTNMLTPRDLDRMLDHMRDLSAAGAHDAARQELARMQQILESLHTEPKPQWTAEQKKLIDALAALRDMQKQQQQVLDKTFHNTQQSASSQDSRELAQQQGDLQRQLQQLMQGLGQGQPKGLDRSDSGMKQAFEKLQQGAGRAAMPAENQALQGLQQAMQGLAQDLRSSMMMLSQPGMEGMSGAGSDPFGRQANFMPDDNGVKVPDQMEVRRVRQILDELQRRSGDMGRPKTERDYIDRLLQNY
jgi:uncharacterized protein (TIGR02302 family)